MTYSEKLKDQRWQKKRLELLEAAQWKCRSPHCQNEKDRPTLHVHHKLYLRNTAPWEYEDWAYVVLCDECHELEQANLEQIHSFIAKNDSMATALWWLAKLDPETQREFSEALQGIAALKPEYVKPFIGLFSSVVAFRMDIMSAVWSNTVETNIESAATA